MGRRVVSPGDFIGSSNKSCPIKRKTIRVQISGMGKAGVAAGRRGAPRNTAIAHEADGLDGETRRMEGLQERMEAW